MRSAIALLCVAALACASVSAEKNEVASAQVTASRQTKKKKTATTPEEPKKKTTATLYENEWLKLTCRVNSSQCQHLEKSCPQGKYREECLINKLTTFLRTLRFTQKTSKYCKAKGMKRTCSRLTLICRRSRGEYRKAVCEFRIAFRAYRRLLNRRKGKAARVIRYKCYRTKACMSAVRTIMRRNRRSWSKIARRYRKMRQTFKTCKGKNATCYLNIFKKQLGWSSRKKSGKKTTSYRSRRAARRTIKKVQNRCKRQSTCRKNNIRFFNCKYKYMCRSRLMRSTWTCLKNARCAGAFKQRVMIFSRCLSSRVCARRLLGKF